MKNPRREERCNRGVSSNWFAVPTGFTDDVSSWGQSCLNCWHVSSVQIQSAENDPSCRGCWGILWAYFFLELLGWWFQTFFMFIPKIGEMIQFDERIFQMGWFNHQLYRKELSQIFLHGSKMKDDSQLEDSQILSKLPFFPRCHEYVTYSCKCFAQGFQDVKSVPKGMGFLKHPTRWWFQIFI